MTSIRLALGVVVAIACSVLGFSGSVSAAEPPVPSNTVIAVTGGNHQLYVRKPGDAAWTNLGGLLIEAPGVAAVKVGTSWVTHYVGIGTNGLLYQRTDTTGWRRLTALDYRCTQVSLMAEMGKTTVFGTCTGPNGAAYVFSFDGAVKAPTVTLGKASANNQVIGQVNAQRYGENLYLFAQGPAYLTSAGYPGTVWYTVSDGVWYHADVYSQNAPGGDAGGWYELYQQPNDQLYVRCYGESPPLTYFIPGRSVGAPALVLRPDRSAQAFVTGTNGSIYTQRLTCDGSGLNGWTKLSGLSPFGVAATDTFS